MTNEALLKAPCGKYKSRRGVPFTKQTLADHTSNCPQCNQNRIILDPNDFIGNENSLIKDFDFDDEPDGAYWALNAELNGDLDD